MNNLLKAISLFSTDKDLKENFLSEFDEQINSIENDVEKWENYKTFFKNKDTLILFLDKFEYFFIVNELIIKAVDGSSLSKDNLSIIFFDELEKYFYIKNKKWINSDELEYSKDLLRDFWIILKQNLLDSAYSGLENHELYKSLKNNINFLFIILYIVLSYIKSNSDYKVWDLTEFFSWIYQYFHLNRQKNEFSIHLILITIIIVFFEEQNSSFETQRIDSSNYRETHSLSELIDSIILSDKNEEFYKIFNLLKDFNLIFNFLLKLEEKDSWLSKDYINYSLNVLLSKDDLLLDKDLISFSRFFLEYQEELYIQIIKLREFKESLVLDLFKEYIDDTIDFLLIEENKKYLTEKISINLINILKENIISDFELKKENYKKILVKFIDWELGSIDLWLNMIEFWNNLINFLIKYLTWNEDKYELIYFYLGNIKKILFKDDIKDFKNKFHNEVINNIFNINLEKYVKIKDLFIDFKIERRLLDDLSSKVKISYLDNINILRIFKLLLDDYKGWYKYAWLKENMKTKLNEDISLELKSELEHIIKLL